MLCIYISYSILSILYKKLNIIIVIVMTIKHVIFYQVYAIVLQHGNEADLEDMLKVRQNHSDDFGLVSF